MPSRLIGLLPAPTRARLAGVLTTPMKPSGVYMICEVRGTSALTVPSPLMKSRPSSRQAPTRSSARIGSLPQAVARPVRFGNFVADLVIERCHRQMIGRRGARIGQQVPFLLAAESAPARHDGVALDVRLVARDHAIGTEYRMVFADL